MTEERQRSPDDAAVTERPKRVFMLGATGAIGGATTAALIERGHEVVCFLRSAPRAPGRAPTLPEQAEVRFGDVSDPASLAHDGLRGEPFDALVSCMASRTGAPADAWAIDYRAHVNALEAAKAAGVGQMVLLSAICVQKPRLAFQHAKLAFEAELVSSGLTWSIVRPTAYFKSLSGQVDRVRAGKPYLVFGDGTLTACKPISDRDLATYLVDCLDDPSRHDRILPVGGPGPAQTPREQGEALFALLGQAPRFRSVPPAMLDVIAGLLAVAGACIPRLAAKAELARIGRYYATESMLVLNPATGVYDADGTPEFGEDTLADFHARLIRGEVSIHRGDQAVF
jgi:divinyl chlorophyllide a 8-vinyl-reductase